MGRAKLRIAIPPFEVFPNVDRITRKNLKTDQVAETAFDLLHWTSEHKTMAIRYGSAVVVLGLAWFGYSLYSTSQATARQEALAKALRLDEATIGKDTQPAAAHFDTEDEKTKASQAAFSAIASGYSGSQEGAIAKMYLAGAAAEKGDTAQAEKLFQSIIDDGPKDYAALASVSLAQLYGSEGKTAEAEKMLRAVMDHPTAMVSKESAELTLAQVLAKSNPQEARKILSPLVTIGQSRGAVIRAAVSLSAQLPQQNLSIPVPVDKPAAK